MKNLLDGIDSDSTVWAKDEDWIWVEGDVKIKALVNTSSWQQMAMSNVSATYRDVVTPGIDDFGDFRRIKEDEPSSRVKVLWAGDPRDSTVEMLVAILEQLNIDYHLDVYNTVEGHQMTLNSSRVSVHDYDERSFRDCCVTHDVYATPTMSMRSYDEYASVAYAGGCLVVAPNHSGYTERFQHFGFLSPYSMKDNVLYASAFGQRLGDAMSFSKKPDSTLYRNSQISMCGLWSKKIEQAKLAIFQEFVELEELT